MQGGNGDFVQTANGDLLALPFSFLLKHLGVAMDHPLRFVGCAVTVLAVLADCATARWSTMALAGAMGFIVVEHLGWAPNVWPIATADATVPAVYETLGQGAIIDLPAARGESIAPNRYLYWQGLHGHPIPYAHKVGPDLPNTNPVLRRWTGLSRTGPAGPHSQPQDPSDTTTLSVRALAKKGFRWVVMHPDMMASEALQTTHRQQLTDALGAPVIDAKKVVWALPELSP